jgi:hypothetical protein
MVALRSVNNPEEPRLRTTLRIGQDAARREAVRALAARGTS